MTAAAGVRVGVCGLGLIGGSALLGLREAGVDVRGCDPHPAPRDWCAALGVPVDADVAATARAVDVLLVCVPPHATAAVVAAALGEADDLVVLDAASVKGPVVDEVRRRVPDAAGRFLPAHPLAGAERAGHDAARADLLCDVPWAVCPPADDPEGEADALDVLLRAAPVLAALRAHLVVCTAAEHDRAVAATSHAPHLVAGTVGRVATEAPTGGPLAAALSGGSLRDATRVAGAPAGMWTEVLHANADATADALEATAAALTAAADALRREDRAALEGAWTAGGAAQAAIRRRRWTPPRWEPVALPSTWAALLALGRDGVAVRDVRVDEDGRLAAKRSVTDAG